MKASPLEFRFRFLIHAIIYFLGFTAPWNYSLHLDSIRTWQFLAAWLARNGWLTFSAATIAVLVLGILFAFTAAFLRTWASAYLGTSIVQAPDMHGKEVVAAGPYRYLRNPLYLGIFIHTLALALLMPPTGAIFSILAIGFFQLRLIAGEESFLTTKLGESYVAYCAKVPRLVPALTPRVPASTIQPKWPIAFLGEIYMWGVVISLGISLIVRAFLPRQPQ
jgi:protein-S-isoprenylcysteine O-methyltransferase Ste14